MKWMGLVLFFTVFIGADELDMFDVVDSESNVTRTIEYSNINARLKVSYLANNKSSNDAVFYANLSDNEKHYFYDVRMVMDEDNFDVHIKDLYYKSQIDEKYFIELGRMNVKEGVSRGYNPTDYFRGSSSLTLSIDPKERKDNRLGSLLMQGTYIADNFTIKALYAPEVSVKGNLNLHESNTEKRVTLYAGYTGLDEWSISALLHHNNDGLHVGANVSYIQERAIWYMEASLNKRESTIQQALEIVNAPNSLVEIFDNKEAYITELSLGVNYTFENNIVTTFEYIYNEAGLDSKEWDNYFDLMHNSYAPIVGSARGTIANKSQMLSKHTLFMMARQSDVIPNVDWVTMGWMNPIDRSALIQVGLSYDYKDMVFSADIRSYIGKNRSEYGSMQNEFEALLSVEYFF